MEDKQTPLSDIFSQVGRKAVKRGFELTIMVVGDTGLGKSTFINTMFDSQLYEDRPKIYAEERIQRTVEIERRTIVREDKGVKICLNFVDTPGFGDALNSEEHWRVVEGYIKDQYNKYYQEEIGLNRKNIKDTKVHCVLYFISPFGYGLRQLDRDTMSRLGQTVNLVPIIAKADTLSKHELDRFKKRVLRDLEESGIRFFRPTECDPDEDEEVKRQDKEIRESIPFAIVASVDMVEVEGKNVLGRKYPWGVVEVENPLHSDFPKLRTFLLSSHFQELKDTTQDVHYENYRAQHLAGAMKQVSAVSLKSLADADFLLQQKEEELKKLKVRLQQMEKELAAASHQEKPRDNPQPRKD